MTRFSGDQAREEGRLQEAAEVPGRAADPRAVREELDRVLSGPDFVRSQAMQRFLTYVVEESLRGNEGRLKAYTIAVEALGRDSGFDPTTDTIVRTQAARVRRALEHHYLTAGASSPLRIEMPAFGYRPTFRVCDGLPTPSPAIADPPLEPEITIMPVVDMSKDGSLRMFAEELSLQLLVALGKFEGFRIVSQAYNPQAYNPAGPRPLPNVLAPLARFSLAVAVCRDGRELRTTALLHDTGSGEVLWSDVHQCDYSGVDGFRLQQRISRRISSRLADINGVIPRAITRRAMGRASETLSFYEITYRYLNNPIRSREQYLELLASLETAQEKAPNHSFAHAILAAACIHDYNYMFDAMDQPLDRALTLSRRAVTLDPNSQYAELFLAYTYAQRREFEQFRVHAERCLELNRNASLCLGQIGLCMTLAGDWERGMALVRRAIELNPSYSRYFHHAPFMDFLRRGDYQAALAEARLYNVPGFFWAPLVRGSVLGMLGLEEEGRAAVNELLSLRPDFVENGWELVRRFVPDEQLLATVMEGLRRSGLPPGSPWVCPAWS